MNALIALIPSRIGEDSVETVSARDLHAFLGSRADFSTWIKQQLDRARLVKGRDYLLHKFVEQHASGAKTKTDAHLTLDAAKHIAMLAGTEKGFAVREYFIECETRAKAASAPAQLSRMELICLAMEAEQERLRLEAVVAEQAPKVAFADAVASAENAQSVGEVAKVLGTGQRRLFGFLREAGYLMPGGTLPYQRYVDGGYFRVIEQSYETPAGEKRFNTKTLVTGRGLALIQKRFARSGGALQRMS